MTREMNKPYWHNKWVNRPDRWCICTCDECNDCKPKQRVLNPDVAEFVKVLNERLK